MGPQAKYDPVRAHGAWVYLFASVGAGSLLGSGRGIESALLVGTGFVGAFLGTAALAVGVSKKRRQLCIGLLVAVLAPCAALGLGADRAFLAVALFAIAPAAGAVVCALRFGFLSHAAVACGIAALALAAPAAAVSGGVGAVRAATLFLLLWSFYCWRSLRLAASLDGAGTWKRDELRTRGLREARITALWTLAVASGLWLA